MTDVKADEHKKIKKEKKAKKEDAKRKLADDSVAPVKAKREKVNKEKKDSKENDGSGIWTFKETVVDFAIITEFLTKNEIIVTELDNKPYDVTPILKFKQAGFPKVLRKTLEKFPAPSPIQSVTWPPILKGRDMVGIAATGSGKTIAFGVPGLMHIQNKMNQGASIKPQVLVLSPTRELAMQIQEQFELFGTSSGMKSVCIYGGVPKYEQKTLLRKGMQAIVATPGRLIDLFEEDSSLCDLSDIGYLVLDEADRMLDQGFEEAIRKIIARLPATRQTVMFSATWPTSIKKMAMSYLSNPVKVTVGSTDLSANIRIEQRVEVLEPQAKESRLMQLIKEYHSSRTNRILIFALYKKEASRLEAMIKRAGYKAAAIHGDLSQQQRTAALDGFRNGTSTSHRLNPASNCNRRGRTWNRYPQRRIRSYD
jgi:ATP-dependent RNA helicase DBP3